MTVVSRSNKDTFMKRVMPFFLNALNSIWSSLIDDPIKSISAIAATISASAAIGALIVGWKNFKKDTTSVDLVVKRAQNGPLILQYPQKEYLLFEVYNQGITPVVINEVGVKIHSQFWRKLKLINLVDLPYSHLPIRGQESAIGSLECTDLPGTIKARSMGVFLLDYSGMRDAAINLQERNIPSTDLDFVGSKRVIEVFHEFQGLEKSKGKQLQITPYVLTGAGEVFIGKKANIHLGHLGNAVS